MNPARVVLASAALLAAPAAARADVPDATGLLEATAYALPVGCSALTGTYHATYLAYGEGAPAGWRNAAYLCGGISIGLGTYLLVDDGGETTRGTVLGVVPIVVGSYAVLTALFVGAPDDLVGGHAAVTPWVGGGGGGLVWSGRF